MNRILTNAWQTVVVIVVVLAMGIFIGLQFAPTCSTPNEIREVPAMQQG